MDRENLLKRLKELQKQIDELNLYWEQEIQLLKKLVQERSKIEMKLSIKF